MSLYSFYCTVIKAHIKGRRSEKPNTFVTLSTGNIEHARTSIQNHTNSPKWNSKFTIQMSSDGSLMVRLHRKNSETELLLLAARTVLWSEIDNLLKRCATLFIVKKLKLKLVNADSENTTTTYSVTLGISKTTMSCAVCVANPPLFSESHMPTSCNVTTQNPGSTAAVDIDSLPEGWERRLTQNGREYFVDNATHVTQWEHPQPLPPGWETRTDGVTNKVYYFNPSTNATSWQRPTQEIVNQYNTFLASRGSIREAQRRDYDQRYLQPADNTKVDVPEYNTENKNLADVVYFLLGPLPDDVERKVDSATGRFYFSNHKLHTTSWEDPRLFWLLSDINPLPADWSLRYNQIGIPYFIDHNSKKTTYNDPRNGVGLFPPAAIAIYYKKLFKEKLSYFNYLCKTHIRTGTVKIIISRDKIFADSFGAVMAYSPNKLHKHIFVKIENEEGLDYGGLAREWFFELSHEISNPMYCLFTSQNSQSNYLLEINPLSGVNPNHLKYFNFFGRIIGLALLHSKLLDCSFSTVFYKQILNRKCRLDDLKFNDMDFYNSVNWLTTNNIEEAGLELFFCTEIESFGELKLIELKPDGKNIQVSEDNKHEYIKLLVEWKVNYGKTDQICHLILGLSQIIPLTWLQTFSIKEFENLLCGMHNYDIEDWKHNVRFKGGYSANSIQIEWFWKLMKSLDPEHLGKVLFFVTGTTRIPSTGFKDLVGSNGPQKFCFERWGTLKDLPRAHTCFNRIDLPPYDTYEKLREKILFAIEEGKGFYEE